MDALTLVLVGALCGEGENACSYIDASRKYELKTDAECWQAAEAMNTLNRFAGQDIRYACLEKAVTERLKL